MPEEISKEEILKVEDKVEVQNETEGKVEVKTEAKAESKDEVRSPMIHEVPLVNKVEE
jgi:hypothetical protein